MICVVSTESPLSIGRSRRTRRFGAVGILCLGMATTLLTSCSPEIRILYSASLNGNLLGCDCWGYPEAGLDKRALYLADNPKQPGDILLDAGNVLEEGRQPFLADLILETYRELDYDAVSVGLNELAEGPETLAKRTDSEAEPRLLAHNLILDGQSLSDGPLIVHPEASGRDGVSGAIVSLADPEWFDPYLHLYNDHLTVEDCGKAFSRAAGRAEEAGSAGIVLLAHGREAWIRELADTALFRESSIPVVAIVLAGEEKLIEDRLAGGIPLLSPGEEGNRLGILKLRLRTGGRWKNEFIEFHFLGPGHPRIAARGEQYRTWLDEQRRP